MLTVKVDSTGDSLWAHGFSGGEGRSKGFAATETVNGDYVIAGEFFGSEWDFLIVRCDADGSVQWTQTCGRSDTVEFARAIVEMPNGDFMVAGRGELDLYRDIYLARLDSLGNVRWTHAVACSSWSQVYGIAVLPDSSVAIVGQLDNDMFLLRVTEADSIIDNTRPPRFLRPDLRLQVFPNPFNMNTTLSFSVPRAAQLRLDLFDIQGRLQQTLTDELYPAGYHELLLASDKLASGVYFVRLKTDQNTRIQRLIHLK
jgi:hypothetical protein